MNIMKTFLFAMGAMLCSQTVYTGPRSFSYDYLIEADPTPPSLFDRNGNRLFPLQNEYQSPLHRAVSWDNLQALKDALKAGVNICARDSRWQETPLYRITRFADDRPISSTRDMIYAILQAYPNRRLLEEPGNVKNRTPATELYRNLYNECSLWQHYKDWPLMSELENEHGQQCINIRDLILELRQKGHLK